MNNNSIRQIASRTAAVTLSASICLVASTSLLSYSKDATQGTSTRAETNAGATDFARSTANETGSGERKPVDADKSSAEPGDQILKETKTEGDNPLDSGDSVEKTGVTDGAIDSDAKERSATVTPPAKPNEPPPPTEEQLKKRNDAFGKAAQLMAKQKYDAAIKSFEDAWKSGGDSGEALIYMGSCYYSKKQYPQALKQYQLAAAKGTNFKTRNKAEGMAARLASYMRGVCPDTCLKASTPGWQHRDAAGHPSKELWMHFRYSDSNGSGTVAYSQNHIGEKIGRVNGVPKSLGKCPTCGGTGRVSLP